MLGLESVCGEPLGGQGRAARSPLSIERRASDAEERVPATEPVHRVWAHAKVTRRGRAAGALLLVLLIAALAAVVGWTAFSSDDEPGEETEAVAPPSVEVAVPAAPADAVAGPREAVGPSADAGREVAPTPPKDLGLAGRKPDPHAERFEGSHGRIRGYIEMADDTPFPKSWRLVVGPSTTLVGRERAENRVVEFFAGEQEFVVEGLPLAGYDVRPEADGMNGRRHPVMLDRRSKNPYITLHLSPAGFLTGRLVDAEGLPAEGVEITIEASGSGSVWETKTDALGYYRMDRVLDGEYKLSFGPRTNPLLAPEWIRFSAPSMTFPERKLPTLSELSILVLDAQGHPVANAVVEGSGNAGGYVREETDAYGKALAKLLPDGRYRLTVRHETLGRMRNSVDVAGGETAEVRFRFRPR